VGTSWRITWEFPFGGGTLPCRILEDPVDHAFYLARYELTRRDSPFNERLYARRNFDGSILSYLGNTRFRKDASGVTQDGLEPAKLGESLVSDLGLSEEIVERLGRCGGLG
jgi:hypothetical protein